MKQTENRFRKKRMLLLLLLICGIAASLLSCAAPERESSLIANEAEIRDFYLEGRMPGFRRLLPLAEDDPLLSEGVPEDAEIPYRRGLVYEDVNDSRVFDEETGTWKGAAPGEDAGWLIGGNAKSVTAERQLDEEWNDFASVLPCATLYVPWNSVSFNKGIIEYSFYTKDFNFNAFPQYDPSNISVAETVAGTTRYTQLFDDAITLPVSGRYRSRSWTGVVYTGGIRKTTLDENGEPVLTCVSNPGDARGLFSVRYKDAVQDRHGKWFDLVLNFTQITFAAESDVSGALQIMEGNKLCVSPILYDGGQYLINLNDEADPSGDPLKSEGVIIGAKFEISYSIESEDGVPADGLLLYSVRDLDHPSMAMSLENGADWGLNEFGLDYRWAEGVGFTSGAASFAVSPYYNHGAGEAADLLHVSRMEGIPADGTANGLMFSAGSALPHGEDVRNDGETFDTGFATLIRPRGSMVVTLSADRREYLELTLFAPNISNRIYQGPNSGGRVSTLGYSLEDGTLTEYRDDILVAAVGDTLEHVIRPNPGYEIKSIRIDGDPIDVDSLQWEARDDGSETAVAEGLWGEHRFVRDADGAIHYWFGDIISSHTIRARFSTKILHIPGDYLVRKRTAILFASLAFALVLGADVLWMTKKKRD